MLFQFRKNASSYRREVAARLKKLAAFGPMVDGSLVVVRRRCGNPGCRCTRGEKHPAHYLTRKVGRKTHSLYIPVALVEDVRAWNQEFRRLKRLVSEICERQRKVVAAAFCPQLLSLLAKRPPGDMASLRPRCTADPPPPQPAPPTGRQTSGLFMSGRAEAGLTRPAARALIPGTSRGQPAFQENAVVDNELEFKVQQLEQLVNQWKRFFTLYRKILKPGEATPKEEHDYGDLATTFARIYTPIATRTGLKPQAGAGVLDMVTTVPDAQAVRDLSDMQRRKFENDWRSNNTDMNQKLGELQLLREELSTTSAFTFYMRRFFSNTAAQWCVGLSVVIILLGVFGFFGILRDALMALIKSVK